ncbi:MAG: hydrogenase nickel incorporation protein HypB [Acidobacteria bacterium]|nr:hydrogenase nickel incorporation protein HypB [Acidobacteriota bacterium]MCB9397624.1 hydrogenase nickel incorporation protein HypB [Acidobacteriota bacterium]
MCRDCGCSDSSSFLVADHLHHPVKLNGFHHSSPDQQAQLLAYNDQIAEHNRAHLAEMGVSCINLMSAPGSGKTLLLERLAPKLGQVWVIEGDLNGALDADRLKRCGISALQVQTGQACHLDAEMVHHALHQMPQPPPDLLVIENVGNLACPADFDLGESRRIAMISVTEGDDKPLKYPNMMRCADLLLISKIDLLPYVDFELERCVGYAQQINPDLKVLSLSAKTGQGLADLIPYIKAKVRP